MSRHPFACAVAFAVLAAGCPPPDDTVFIRQTPEIAVAPAALDFGDRAVPVVHEDGIYVSNGGRADLTFTATVEGPDAAVFSLPVTEATVAPDDALDLRVAFAPTTFLDYAAELVLTTNDEDSPEVRVPLTGTGVSAPLPDIALSETSVDFGEVATTAQAVVTLRNVGTAPLKLGTLRFEGSGAFSLLADPSGNTLAAGDDFPLVLIYAPTDDAGDTARLVLPSDDPDEPETPLLLLGNGGADFEYPVAVIDCPGPTDPPRLVQLDGDDSFDPEGGSITAWWWTLASVPTDASGATISAATLTNATGPDTALFLDAVGAYEIELVVANDVGVRSAPARCVIDAIPDEDIHVELTWDTPRADVDLHLAQAGNPLFSTPWDVSFCNRAPGWGGAGDADDPRLDLDDRAGFGPENIVIPTPADGAFDVRVHYFDDQGDAAVVATVRVYVRGALAFAASQRLTRNEVWDAARINWPAGTVGALSAPPYDAPRRTCGS